MVFEITSRSTRREDEIFKPQSYARIGVKEYFLYDPTADYLDPPLIGFRLAGERRQPVLPDAQGRLDCRELGLQLWLEGTELVLADAATGLRLVTEAEAAEARAEEAAALAEQASARAEQAAALAEQASVRAEQSDARAEAAEAEVRRLRDELAKLRRPAE